MFNKKQQAVVADRSVSFKEWLKAQVDAENYWFHRIELAPDLVTPGWSDPKTEKLPFFGLPDDMTGLRVLDVGCAEGFFSFEAERRGAREVIAIDSYPESVRRFNICRNALNSKATAFLCNVYDLNVRAFGTFDIVFFFGVLYHLRNPILALEKVFSVCTGTMLMQTAGMVEIPNQENVALAQFYPHGMQSGTPENPMFDPTVFWLPNVECTRGLVSHVGFQNVEVLSTDRAGTVLRAQSPTKSPGERPDDMKAPWS
jgi:tRNA (mo5U34)-methyltransferase